MVHYHNFSVVQYPHTTYGDFNLGVRPTATEFAAKSPLAEVDIAFLTRREEGARIWGPSASTKFTLTSRE